jgi:hypothetical protein
MYARKLTKEELMKSGITAVTEDGHVFSGERELLPSHNKQGYLIHFIYDFDENGNYIKIPNSKSVFGYNYKQRTIGLHRLMWAWFHDVVESGMVIDHISNKHLDFEDYHLSNLDCTTPRKNIMKEREESAREIPCKLYRPRSYYEDKLNQFDQEYEQAKLDGDAHRVHQLRSYRSQYRGRLRYWDSHAEEAKKLIAEREAAEAEKKATAEEKAALAKFREEAKAKKELKAKHIKVLRELADTARANGDNNRWHAILRVINNYEAFPQDKLNLIVEKEEAKRKALVKQ